MPERGEVKASIRTQLPQLGLIGMVDQTRAGLHVFEAESGLYVDTMFLSKAQEESTVYGLPDEFWVGRTFLNRNDGQMYAQMGKQSMVLFRLKGWANHSVRSLPMLNSSVRVDQVALPNYVAAQLRGTGKLDGLTLLVNRTAEPPALDGSLRGWESASHAKLWGDSEHVVRASLLHDDDRIFLRAEMDLGSPLVGTQLYPNWQRLFTHGVGGSTLSLYFQTNLSEVCNPGLYPHATHGQPELYCAPDGLGLPTQRLVRLVFGVFDTARGEAEAPALEAVAVGIYPFWHGGDGSPYTYGTHAAAKQGLHFENVRLLNQSTGVTSAFRLDPTKTKLTIAASIDRRLALPGLPPLSNLSTSFDISSTMSGKLKFWWCNRAFYASAGTFDEGVEASLYPEAWGGVGFV